jgi:heparan-alpha-glucosaminide N-acetyltransferase
MEKGQEIAASDGEKGPEQHQHAIDVGHAEHGDGKGEDIEKERVVVAEDVQKKKSRRVAALDAFRGLTIVVHTYIHPSAHIYFLLPYFIQKV